MRLERFIQRFQPAPVAASLEPLTQARLDIFKGCGTLIALIDKAQTSGECYDLFHEIQTLVEVVDAVKTRALERQEQLCGAEL